MHLDEKLGFFLFEWSECEEWLQPGKWVQVTEEWESKYHIPGPFRVGDQDPIQFIDDFSPVIRSDPDYGIFIKTDHIEPAKAPADSVEGLQARVAELVEENKRMSNELALAEAFMIRDVQGKCLEDARTLEAIRTYTAGIGLVVESLEELHGAAYSVSGGDWELDFSIKGITTKSGLCDIGFNLARWDAEFMVSAFNKLPTLLSTLRKIKLLLQ